jgi:hypothetical protein
MDSGKKAIMREHSTGYLAIEHTQRMKTLCVLVGTQIM